MKDKKHNGKAKDSLQLTITMYLENFFALIGDCLWTNFMM